MTKKAAPSGNSPVNEIKDRIIKIKLVDGTQVNGQININRDPRFNRVSDILASKHESFLILSNVSVYHANFDDPEKKQTLFINKNHIIWASPDEDQK